MRSLIVVILCLIFASSALVSEFLATFKDFPPRQKAASFTIDQIMERMTNDAFGAGR